MLLAQSHHPSVDTLATSLRLARDCRLSLIFPTHTALLSKREALVEDLRFQFQIDEVDVRMESCTEQINRHVDQYKEARHTEEDLTMQLDRLLLEPE